MNLEQRIAEALMLHFPNVETGWADGNWYFFCDHLECNLSTKIEPYGQAMSKFIAHQAAVVAGIVQAELAEAWDACVNADTPWINPYRTPKQTPDKS